MLATESLGQVSLELRQAASSASELQPSLVPWPAPLLSLDHNKGQTLSDIRRSQAALSRYQ